MTAGSINASLGQKIIVHVSGAGAKINNSITVEIQPVSMVSIGVNSVSRRGEGNEARSNNPRVEVVHLWK